MSLNLDYFFKLSDKEKRDFFVSLLPPINSEDILNSLSEFEANIIAEDLEKIDEDPNEYLKKARAKLANNEMEINRLLGKLEGLKPDKKDIPDKKVFDVSQLKALEKQYDELTTAKVDTKNIEVKIENLKKQKNELEQKMAVVKNSVVQEKLKDSTELLQKKLVIQNKINSLKNKQYVKTKEKDIISLTTKIKFLREKYKKERFLPIKEDMTCPVCRQLINKKDIKDAKKIISKNLIDIQNQAKTINLKIDELKKEEEENEIDFNNKIKTLFNNKTKKLSYINSKISKIENFNSSLVKEFEDIKSSQIDSLIKKISNTSKKIKSFEKNKERC